MIIDVTLALLKQGRSLNIMALILLLLTVLIFLFFKQNFGWLLIIAITFWLMESYYYLRVDLDYRLFKSLREKQQQGEVFDGVLLELDSSLKLFGLISQEKGNQPVKRRCQGAIQLLKKQCIIVSLQVVVVFLMIIF